MFMEMLSTRQITPGNLDDVPDNWQRYPAQYWAALFERTCNEKGQGVLQPSAIDISRDERVIRLHGWIVTRQGDEWIAEKYESQEEAESSGPILARCKASAHDKQGMSQMIRFMARDRILQDVASIIDFLGYCTGMKPDPGVVPHVHLSGLDEHFGVEFCLRGQDPDKRSARHLVLFARNPLNRTGNLDGFRLFNRGAPAQGESEKQTIEKIRRLASGRAFPPGSKALHAVFLDIQAGNIRAVIDSPDRKGQIRLGRKCLVESIHAFNMAVSQLFEGIREEKRTGKEQYGLGDISASLAARLHQFCPHMQELQLPPAAQTNAGNTFAPARKTYPVCRIPTMPNIIGSPNVFPSCWHTCKLTAAPVFTPWICWMKPGTRHFPDCRRFPHRAWMSLPGGIGRY